TKAPSQPYLTNIFLISCSPAELISASVGKSKCKAILGLNKKCKFVSGLSVKLSKNCKLFSGRVSISLQAQLFWVWLVAEHQPRESSSAVFHYKPSCFWV